MPNLDPVKVDKLVKLFHDRGYTNIRWRLNRISIDRYKRTYAGTIIETNGVLNVKWDDFKDKKTTQNKVADYTIDSEG